MRLLAERLVALRIVKAVSDETVRRVLKKRAQAVAEAAMVHHVEGERRVRLADGRRPGGLLPPVRPETAVGLPG
jgi:hypothetical protein